MNYKLQDFKLNIRMSGDDEVITLKVRWTLSAEDIEFKVKKKTPFEKIYKALSDRYGVPEDQFRLIFDGERLKGEQTAKMVELEDGDMIEAVIQQQGGFIFQ